MNGSRRAGYNIITTTVFLGVLGCTITQTVDPIEVLNTKDVCIIEDPEVRAGFVREYTAALEEKGYNVKLLAGDSSTDACKVTSTYLARWSWDLALYMSYAEISVYQDGALTGRALYDSRSGSGNMEKFIDAEPKIRELVNELYPK